MKKTQKVEGWKYFGFEKSLVTFLINLKMGILIILLAIWTKNYKWWSDFVGIYLIESIY